MLLFPIALAVGIALGHLRGGSFGSLGGVRLHLPGVLPLAVMLQVGLSAVRSPAMHLVLLVGSYALVGLWLTANLIEGPRAHRAGLACVAAGYALNLAAIIPSGKMPVSVSALRQVGASPEALSHPPNLAKHATVTDGDVLSWLGDVVALAPLGAVISVGDMAMVLGVLVVLCVGMTHERKRLG